MNERDAVVAGSRSAPGRWSSAGTCAGSRPAGWTGARAGGRPARAALDAQLVRRTAAAASWPALACSTPRRALLVADAATLALAAGETRSETEWLEAGGPVEEVENDLTRALHAAFGDPQVVADLRAVPLAAQSLELLGQACVRVQLARRFHNDAVSQTLRVRRKARRALGAGSPGMRRCPGWSRSTTRFRRGGSPSPRLSCDPDPRRGRDARAA